MKTSILVLCSLFLSLSAMAQFGTQDRQAQPFVSAAPSFQSTSTMAGTGSAYAAQPMLNTDGTAAYGASSATAAPGRTSGPRKANAITGAEEDDGLPIGDAVLPLIAFAMIFCGYIAIRRRRNAV